MNACWRREDGFCFSQSLAPLYEPSRRSQAASHKAHVRVELGRSQGPRSPAAFARRSTGLDGQKSSVWVKATPLAALDREPLLLFFFLSFFPSPEYN